MKKIFWSSWSWLHRSVFSVPDLVLLSASHQSFLHRFRSVRQVTVWFFFLLLGFRSAPQGFGLGIEFCCLVSRASRSDPFPSLGLVYFRFVHPESVAVQNLIFPCESSRPVSVLFRSESWFLYCRSSSLISILSPRQRICLLIPGACVGQAVSSATHARSSCLFFTRGSSAVHLLSNLISRVNLLLVPWPRMTGISILIFFSPFSIFILPLACSGAKIF
jgi:hypothetical protein